MTAVKLARQQDTIVTGKPRYDSKSKGLVENAHRLVQGLLRTWVASMEKRYQTTLTPSSPLVQWGVRHFCSSLTRYTVLEEGLTSVRKTELRDTVLFHARLEPEVSQEMGERTQDGQDVVHRRAHLGRRRQAGSWRKMTQGQKTRNGPRLGLRRWFVHHQSRSSVCFAMCTWREESWKGLDPRLGGRHAREEVACTLTSAAPGWKNA